MRSWMKKTEAIEAVEVGNVDWEDKKIFEKVDTVVSLGRNVGDLTRVSNDEGSYYTTFHASVIIGMSTLVEREAFFIHMFDVI